MKSRTMNQYASCPQLEKHHKGRAMSVSSGSGSSSELEKPISETDLAIRQITSKYDSYKGLLQAASRRRYSEGGESLTDDDSVSNVNRFNVSEQERLQIESFFRGLKTHVFVSNSLANLYFTTADRLSTAQDGSSSWELRYTGIPLVILDSGETRSRSKKKIQILLAERGTCFTLWKDVIDNLTSYKVAGNAFHTMYLSSDHRQLAGLSFDSPSAAHELFAHVEELTSNPENISLSMPGAKKKNKHRKKPERIPLPPKSQISQPCCFQHVNSVDASDRNRYFSLQALVPVPGSEQSKFLRVGDNS